MKYHFARVGVYPKGHINVKGGMTVWDWVHWNICKLTFDAFAKDLRNYCDSK